MNKITALFHKPQFNRIIMFSSILSFFLIAKPNAEIIPYEMNGLYIDQTDNVEYSFTGRLNISSVEKRESVLFVNVNEFVINSETHGTFSGNSGFLSFTGFDMYLGLYGTGFTNQLYIDVPDYSYSEHAQNYTKYLQDNYYFHSLIFYETEQYVFTDASLSRINISPIPEPTIEFIFIFGLICVGLFFVGPLLIKKQIQVI